MKLTKFLRNFECLQSIMGDTNQLQRLTKTSSISENKAIL